MPSKPNEAARFSAMVEATAARHGVLVEAEG
jgi:hypothetical protein